jgi:DNA-binding transcriptional MocR family regulator
VQRRRIAALSEELQLPVIEDHTLSFFELNTKTPPPRPIASFAEVNSRILTIGSLSKLLWAGLRIGWVRGSASIIASLTRVKLVDDLGSPILDQAIAARLIPHLGQAQKLRQNQLLPRKRLLESLLKSYVPDWEWQEPEGGLFLWVKLPGGRASELAQLGLRNGVMLMPGENLAVDGSYLNYLRLPFFLEPLYLQEGVERIASTWNSYKEGLK